MKIAEVESLEVYAGLSDLQKKLVNRLIESPDVNRMVLSEELGISKQTIYNFVSSREFAEINAHITVAKKGILLTKALRVFEECLDSKDVKVKFKAAMAVLVDAGVFSPEGKTVDGPKNITVVWEKNAANGQLRAEPKTETNT